MEKELNAEFDAWFTRLVEAAKTRGYKNPLNAEDWTEFWSDGYTPTDALDEDEQAGL